MVMHTGAKMQTSSHGLIATAAAQLAVPSQAAPNRPQAALFPPGGGLGTPSPSGAQYAIEGSVFAGGVVFVPAFTGLGAPYWQADARGAIVGLSRCVNDLLMQFQADLLGVAVLRPAVSETTALGAAHLAGLASGVYGGLEELASLWRVGRRLGPQRPREWAAQRMAEWSRAVRQATAP